MQLLTRVNEADEDGDLLAGLHLPDLTEKQLEELQLLEEQFNTGAEGLIDIRILYEITGFQSDAFDDPYFWSHYQPIASMNDAAT